LARRCGCYFPEAVAGRRGAQYRSTALSRAVCPAVSLQMRISRPNLGLHNRPGHHSVQAYSYVPTICPRSETISFVQSRRVCTFEASNSSHGRMSDRPPSPSHFRHQPSRCRCSLLLRHARGKTSLRDVRTRGRACAAFMPCSTLSSTAFLQTSNGFPIEFPPWQVAPRRQGRCTSILFLSHMSSRANNGTS
jgi:hypothetical protein